MTWPLHPTPAHARALLLLPSGHRAFDEGITVAIPVPATLELQADVYHLMHLHAGECDTEVRALYVLGGELHPHGFLASDRHAPDEAFDQ